MKVYILIDEVEEAQLLIEDGVLKEIDIDEVAEEWHQKRSDRWDYDTGPDALPTVRFDKTFSQYLENLKC